MTSVLLVKYVQMVPANELKVQPGKLMAVGSIS